jgi:hypothetical protein
MLKLKLDNAGIEYTVNENIEEMEKLGIKSLPHLQLDDGTLLNFGEAIKFVRAVAKGEAQI